MTRFMPLLAALLCCPSALSAAAVDFGNYATVEFAPARGQRFDFPIRVEQPATVTLTLHTSDGEPVRTLASGDRWPPGAHALQWDGKDDSGIVVPDEAYVPVLKATLEDGRELVIDPRTTSGGEVVDKIPVEITSGRDLAYPLPAPCRVLIRIGIKGGPLLRALADWQPRGPGRNVQRWDGYDSSGLLDLRAEPKLSVLVAAFQLPAHAVITTGNTALTYRDYRVQKGWPDPVIQIKPEQLIRNGVRISRHYYAPRAQDADPRITVTLPDDLPRSPEGLPRLKLGQSVPVRADITKEDRWLMDESLYEVAFFVDHQFMSEEEQGYVPLTWLWLVNGLTPGQHLLTVNISGFSGKVGAASLLFIVSE